MKIKYNEVTEAYLEGLMASKTVHYYSDAPHIFYNFDDFDIHDEQFVLKIMDAIVLCRHKNFKLAISQEREIDVVKNMVQLCEIPLNYQAPVKSYSSDYDMSGKIAQIMPNDEFSNRYDIESNCRDFWMKNYSVYSPFSFAVATEMFPIAQAMLKNSNLNVNGNHDERCPHAIDFMRMTSIYNGLLSNLIKRKEFCPTPFEGEIMELIEEATISSKIMDLAHIIELSNHIVSDERFSSSSQKNCAQVRKLAKEKICKTI